jgi:5-oxoprolinase (ATP-hydrolysing)
MYLLRGGQDQWSSLEHLLRSAPHPSRAVDENLADLRAQLAANQRGASENHGFRRGERDRCPRAAMSGLTFRARRLARPDHRKAPSKGGSFSAEERLDDGSLIRVAIHATPDSAIIDFTGSAGIHPGNLNATGAIIRSAVMYVLRLMSAESPAAE